MRIRPSHLNISHSALLAGSGCLRAPRELHKPGFMSYSRGIPVKSMRPLFCYLSLLFAGHLHAQDGGQLYATYCSACHGPDGKGVPAANSPPLSDSPWIMGPPDRATKILLHGLEGPVEILGKPYNLTMPPQGAVLPDD
ncbi:MAG: cytochrome c, partial [Verrucomicrobiaceae bacterium]